MGCRPVDSMIVRPTICESAVADASCARRIDLCCGGRGPWSRVAMAYAARHPEASSTHMVLWMTMADGAVNAAPQRESFARASWKSTGGWLCGDSGRSARTTTGRHPELASQLRSHDAGCSDASERISSSSAEHETWNVAELLSRMCRRRRLVLHPKEHHYFPPEQARRVAAGIPNAELKRARSQRVRSCSPRAVEVAAIEQAMFLGR